MVIGNPEEAALHSEVEPAACFVVKKTGKHSRPCRSPVIAGVCTELVLPREVVLAVAEYTEQHSTELVTLYPESI